jgi:hypothetical protein
MLTQEPGILDALPARPRRARDVAAARWGAPGVALGGTALGAFAADACAPGLALPASGLALTVAGAVLWLTGMSRERRDRIALAIAVALALLSIAALQQFLVCALGREAMMVADLLQAGGLILLLVALGLALDRHRRRRATVAAPVARPPQPLRPLARTVEVTAMSLGRRHGIDVVCDLSADAEADDATRRALLRLLRTAIADAARRGDASTVRVELRKGPRLSVTDDGRGPGPSGSERREPAQAGTGAGPGAGARSASF